MAALIVDEDLPDSLAIALREAGHDAVHVRAVGLAGTSDPDVFAWAREHQRALVTADMGFANILEFPLGSHAGLVVARFPNVSRVATLKAAVVAAINSLAPDDLRGCLVIVEPATIRLRRPPG